jgi:hypothetical protein
MRTLVGAGTLMALACACGGATHPSGTCDLFQPAKPAPRGMLDVTAAKPYRNYIAVTDVGPFAHHFAVWYDDEEPVLEYVRADIDGGGRVHVEFEGGYGGGIAEPPRQPASLPADVAALGRDVLSQLRSRCARGRDFRIAYRGQYRAVAITQFVAQDLRAGTLRGGWIGHAELHVDATLSHVVGTGDHDSGFGSIELPEGARWVTLDPVDTAVRGLLARSARVDDGILAAARDLSARTPGRELSAISVIDPDELLPVGYPARVVMRVAVRRQRTRAQLAPELAIPLDVRDAVFARATGEATVAVGGVRYKVNAALAGDTPQAAVAARETTTYHGTLVVQVQDDRGHVVERSYSASGLLDVQDKTAVAEAGFDLPGASSPSRANDLLHFEFPDDTELELQVSLFDDPRR